MKNEKNEVNKIDTSKNLLKDGFFGWENFKWLIREVSNIYSSKTSYFSKKRLESGVAFAIAQWGMIFFLWQNHVTMTASDLLIWAGIEFGVSGYILNKIQKEKKDVSDADTNVQ